MDLEKPLKFIGFCGGNQYVRLLARRFKNKKIASQIKRKPNQKTTKNEHTSNTPKHQTNIKQQSKNHPKWLPRGGVEGSGGLLAAGSAPRASQNQLRRLSGPQKNCGRAPGGAKRKFGDRFHPPSKPTPPRRGGARGSAHLGFGAFFLKIAAGASAGCKNRGFGV